MANPNHGKPNKKMEAASSVQEKGKMEDGSGFPPPLPCVVAKLLIFEGKGWVQIKIVERER